MSDNETKDQVDSAQSDGKWNSKKEKRVDYQNTDIKMKTGQEIVSKTTTVKLLNTSNSIIEIDLGRDKSVRLDPYGTAEMDSKELNNPNFELVKGSIKIIN